MKLIGLKQAKARLSEFVDAAQRDRILITRRGQPVSRPRTISNPQEHWPHSQNPSATRRAFTASNSGPTRPAAMIARRWSWRKLLRCSTVKDGRECRCMSLSGVMQWMGIVLHGRIELV